MTPAYRFPDGDIAVPVASNNDPDLVVYRTLTGRVYLHAVDFPAGAEPCHSVSAPTGGAFGYEDEPLPFEED